MIYFWKLSILHVEPFIFDDHLYFQLFILLVLHSLEILSQIYDFVSPIFPLYLSFFIILKYFANYELILNLFSERGVGKEQLLSLEWAFGIELELDGVFGVPWSKLGDVSHNERAHLAMIKLINFEY